MARGTQKSFWTLTEKKGLRMRKKLRLTREELSDY